jgi:hypothetical protein
MVKGGNLFRRRGRPPKQPPPIPVWLTRQEVAIRLDRTVSAISKLVGSGHLHPIRTRANTSVFPAAEVEALARGQTLNPWFPLRNARGGASASGPIATTRRKMGDEAARVFRLLHQKKSLRDIVILAGVTPERARALSLQWEQLSTERGPHAEPNGPLIPDGPVPGDLGATNREPLPDGPDHGVDLDALTAAAERLFGEQG